MFCKEMKIPLLPLIFISSLSLFGECKPEDRDESKNRAVRVNDSISASHDRDLISLILDSDEEQRHSAISEFRRRIDKGLFDFDGAMPPSQRDRLISILIEEIEENEEIDVNELFSSNDPWWILISLQGYCIKPDREEWRDWWMNDRSTISWTYPSQNKIKKQNNHPE